MFHAMPIVSGAILSGMVTASKAGYSRYQFPLENRNRVDTLHTEIIRRISKMLSSWIPEVTEDSIKFAEPFVKRLLDDSINNCLNYTGHNARLSVVKDAYKLAKKFQNSDKQIPLSDFHRLGYTIEDGLSGKDVIQLQGRLINRFGQTWERKFETSDFNEIIAESFIAEAAQELRVLHSAMDVKISPQAENAKANCAIRDQLAADSDDKRRAKILGRTTQSIDYRDPEKFFEGVKIRLRQNFLVDYILDNYRDTKVEFVHLSRYKAENKLSDLKEILGLSDRHLIHEQSFERLCKVLKTFRDNGDFVQVKCSLKANNEDENELDEDEVYFQRRKKDIIDRMAGWCFDERGDHCITYNDKREYLEELVTKYGERMLPHPDRPIDYSDSFVKAISVDIISECMDELGGIIITRDKHDHVNHVRMRDLKSMIEDRIASEQNQWQYK